MGGIICFCKNTKCSEEWIDILFFLQERSGRFEMIIIMPDNHKGLGFFRSSALRGFDDPDVANILDDALFALVPSMSFYPDFI